MVLALLVFSGLSAVRAATSQGYKTTENLVSGALVSTDEKDAGTVVAANTDRNARLLGVIVTPAASGSYTFNVMVSASGNPAVSIREGELVVSEQ